MIKDLTVHLDGSDEDEVRLAHSEALLAHFTDAKITGVYTNFIPDYAYSLSNVYGPGLDAGMLASLEERLQREGERAMAHLQKRLARCGPLHEVRRLEAYPSQVPSMAASLARWTDLFVATTPYRDPMSSWDRVVEAVLFSGGRGLYLVPPGCPVRSELRNILFAWQDTPEAAHVAQEAMPLLRQAGNVRLLVVDPSNKDSRGEEVVDAAAHLARHGVTVEVASLRSEDGQVADTILGEADRISADAIVVGAYGHSRFRESVLGGVTRELIETSKLPLMVAH